MRQSEGTEREALPSGRSRSIAGNRAGGLRQHPLRVPGLRQGRPSPPNCGVLQAALAKLPQSGRRPWTAPRRGALRPRSAQQRPLVQPMQPSPRATRGRPGDPAHPSAPLRPRPFPVLRPVLPIRGRLGVIAGLCRLPSRPQSRCPECRAPVRHMLSVSQSGRVAAPAPLRCSPHSRQGQTACFLPERVRALPREMQPPARARSVARRRRLRAARSPRAGKLSEPAEYAASRHRLTWLAIAVGADPRQVLSYRGLLRLLRPPSHAGRTARLPALVRHRSQQPRGHAYRPRQDLLRSGHNSPAIRRFPAWWYNVPSKSPRACEDRESLQGRRSSGDRPSNPS